MSNLIERLLDGAPPVTAVRKDCIEAAERITALENMLRHMTSLARSHAAKTGNMHSWWDSIMDAEAILKGKETLHDWNKP